MLIFASCFSTDRNSRLLKKARNRYDEHLDVARQIHFERLVMAALKYLLGPSKLRLLKLQRKTRVLDDDPSGSDSSKQKSRLEHDSLSDLSYGELEKRLVKL